MYKVEGGIYSMVSKRNYGIDLLRIISMFMIVILHVLGQGGILKGTEVLSLEYNLAWALEIFCYCSVNCYALITGYVMIDSKFKYNKMVKLWVEVVFWSVSLTLLMKLMFPDLVGKKDILFSFFRLYLINIGILVHIFVYSF